MTKIRGRLFGAMLSLSALTAAAAGPALGQTPQTPDSAASAPQSPTAISAAQVLARSDSLRILVTSAATALAVDPRLLAVDSSLTGIAETIDDLATRGDSATLATASFRAFDNLRNRWQLLMEDLTRAQAVADRRAQAVDSVHAEFEREWLTWVVTRDSAVARGYPDALRIQVDSSIILVDQARQVARSRLDSVLPVARRASALRARALDEVAALQETERLRRERLLTPEHPPLWGALAVPSTGASSAETMRAAWRNDLDVWTTFMSQERDVFAFRLVLLVLLVAGLTLLHRRIAPGAGEDPDMKSAVALLGRPFSGALLLFLLSGRLLQPSMPQVSRDVNALLLMLPLARMVPVLVPAVARRAAYGLVVLFTVLEVRSFFLLAPMPERLFGLAENVVVLMGLVWFGRSEAARAIARGRWDTLLGLYLRMGIALVSSALLANVFGLADLAELLSWGVLVGLIAGFLAMAAAILLRATFRVVLRQPFARASAAVRRAPGVIARRFDTMLTFGFVVWWIVFMLGIFRVRDVVVDRATRIVGASLTVGSINISLGDVLAFVLVVWGATQVSRFVRFVLSEDVLPRVHLPRGVPRAITTLTNYVVLGVGFVFAAAAAGIDLSQITLLVGAFGVGIGLGLQSIVNNFVSGIVLLFERPIQVGDTIQVDSILGTAERIGIRASIVRTFDGAEYIVPNGELVSGRVINWSLSDRRRRFEVSVGVAYGTDTEQAMDVLLRVAAEHDAVLSDPAPVARFVAFGDSALELRLLAWTTIDDWLDVSSDLHVRVAAALREEGIQIPFPQRDLHIRAVEGFVPAAPVAAPGTRPPVAADLPGSTA